MRARILLTSAGVLALAAVGPASALAQNGPPGLRASAMPTQSLAMTIRQATGIGHDEHVTLPTFAVEPGLPVRLTFTNYTRRFHTFTSPGLGISALIRPAHGNTPTTTVVTFTAHKHGAFEWVCMLCPDQGSGSSAAMRGKIYAIVQV